MPPGSQEPQGLDWQTLGGLDRHRFEFFIEDFEENAENRLGLGRRWVYNGYCNNL
jgi:hypothetical protein